MTRAPGELLRDVAKALACFASTKHAQAHVQRNPAIKAEMLEEVAYIEALEREVRDAAQAQAGQAMVPRDALEGVLGCHSETDNDSGDEQCLSCHVILASPRRTGVIYQDHEPDCDTVILRAALAQAGAGSEGQGEGA